MAIFGVEQVVVVAGVKIASHGSEVMVPEPEPELVPPVPEPLISVAAAKPIIAKKTIHFWKFIFIRRCLNQVKY